MPGPLLFADEFNAPNFWNATHRPEGLWRDNYGYGGMGDYKFNDEMQVYAGPYFERRPGDFDDGNHVYKDGVLALVAKQSSDPMVLAWNQGGYSSGMITTRGLEPWLGGPTNQFAFKYGYIEARIDPSEEQGAWNAFWLLPAGAANGGWAYEETDIMEKIGQEAHVWQAQHGSANIGQYATNVAHTAGFHTYGLNWTPETMTWFIDGVKTFEIATPANMHQEMVIIANLAVGGSWAGTPNFGADGKAEMLIDYIRVYGPEGSSPPPVVEPPPPPPPVEEPEPPPPPPPPAEDDDEPPPPPPPPPPEDDEEPEPEPEPQGFLSRGTRKTDGMEGGAGDDTIYGLGGSDSLEGNAGDDLLIGGAGDDRFFFAPGFGHDTIQGFDTGWRNDRLVFSDELGDDFDVTRTKAGLLIEFETGDSILLKGVKSGFGEDDWFIG